MSWRKISQKFKSTFRFFRRYSSPYHWLIIPLFFALSVVRITVLILLGRIRNTTDVGPRAGLEDAFYQRDDASDDDEHGKGEDPDKNRQDYRDG